MISKGQLVTMVRESLGYTQPQMASVMDIKRWKTISEYENGKHLTHQRLCQYYVVYLTLGTPDQQLDNLFNNYIEKMFKE